jgi:hypothetical protein
LVEERFGDSQSRALHDFLKYHAPKKLLKPADMHKLCLQYPDRLIKRLTIDDCSVKDQNLALILQGTHA